MTFTCNTKSLKEALSIVSRNLSKNTPMEILKGIYFKTDNNTVSLTATDGTCRTTVTIPTDTKQHGEAVIVAEKLIQFINKLDTEQVTLEASDKYANIVYGNNKARIPVIVGVFPISQQEQGLVPVKFLSEQLVSGLNKTLYCCAGENATHSVLKGVFFEIGSETTNLVSIDGVRGAKTSIRQLNELPGAQELPMKKIVSSKSAADLLKLVQEQDMQEITVYFGATKIYAKFSNVYYESVLLNGEYIDYRRIFTASSTPIMNVQTEELKNTVERAMLFTENGALRMEIGETLMIQQESVEGSINEELMINKYAGADEPVVFGINPKYLLDVLKRFSSDTVVFKKNNGELLNAIVIDDEHGETTSLIMPVQIHAKQQKTA